MKKFNFIFMAVLLITVFSASLLMAQDMYDPRKEKNKLVVKMELLDKKKNTYIGDIVITESAYGLVFTPYLKGSISEGLHGFHVHVNPDCSPDEKGVLGMKAGGHWDPDKTGKHSFPWDDKGHKGDLPALYVSGDGDTPNPVLAPKLKKLSDVKNRSLMIHIGGDNHHDIPVALGGGGARVACGVIK